MCSSTILVGWSNLRVHQFVYTTKNPFLVRVMITHNAEEIIFVDLCFLLSYTLNVFMILTTETCLQVN